MVRTKIAAAAAALVLSTTVFASGVSSARAADLASFAGVYVGHSKVLQGSCTSGTRLISIVIKSTGEARMLFSMKDGTELKGMVDGNGKVTMKTLAGNLILSFEGQIRDITIGGPLLEGKSWYNDGHGCDLGWTLEKEPTSPGSD